MTKRRNVLTLVSVIILSLVLFHFQNCAPASTSVAVGGVDEDPTVRLIDNLHKTHIQFITEISQIQDDAQTVDISGLCAREHDGAGLKFTVWDESNTQTALATGRSACNHGQFAITLQSLEQYVCGVSHMLVVEGDWGSGTYARFSRRCQPLISVQEAVPAQMPYGTSCTLEYSPATAAEDPCLRVCYRANQVVLSQPLDVTQCSSLASSLAGQ